MKLKWLGILVLIGLTELAFCQQSMRNIIDDEQQQKAKLFQLFKAKNSRHFAFLFIKDKDNNRAYINTFRKIPIHKMTFYDRYILSFYFLGLIPEANKKQFDPGYALELLRDLSKSGFNGAISFLKAYAQDLLSKDTKEVRAQIEIILKTKVFSLQEATIYKDLVNKLHATNFFANDYSYISWYGLSVDRMNQFRTGSMMKFFYRLRDRKVITNQELFILGQKFFKSTIYYKQPLVGTISKIIGLRIQKDAISKQPDLEKKFNITSKKLNKIEDKLRSVQPQTAQEVQNMNIFKEFSILQKSGANIKTWYSIPQNKKMLDQAVRESLLVKEIKGLID
jgi:hypothetical protein